MAQEKLIEAINSVNISETGLEGIIQNKYKGILDEAVENRPTLKSGINNINSLEEITGVEANFSSEYIQEKYDFLISSGQAKKVNELFEYQEQPYSISEDEFNAACGFILKKSFSLRSAFSNLKELKSISGYTFEFNSLNREIIKNLYVGSFDRYEFGSITDISHELGVKPFIGKRKFQSMFKKLTSDAKAAHKDQRIKHLPEMFSLESFNSDYVPVSEIESLYDKLLASNKFDLVLDIYGALSDVYDVKPSFTENHISNLAHLCRHNSGNKLSKVRSILRESELDPVFNAKFEKVIQERYGQLLKSSSKNDSLKYDIDNIKKETGIILDDKTIEESYEYLSQKPRIDSIKNIYDATNKKPSDNILNKCFDELAWKLDYHHIEDVAGEMKKLVGIGKTDYIQDDIEKRVLSSIEQNDFYKLNLLLDTTNTSLTSKDYRFLIEKIE